ncbi:hypothetical protein F1880_009990 [Penicillium rolfsii]|nr:hypothetical protein F1880_009990 [Penicillium rolfsii]
MSSHSAKKLNITENEAELRSGQLPPIQNRPRLCLSVDRLPDDPNSGTASWDLWSAAYREAVDSVSGKVDVAILKGKDATRLFSELEDTAKEATHKSFFLKGMRYLESLKVPLDKIKGILDLASPLASLEPTAATVLGVVRGLTAIAISFANADSNFAGQLETMLLRISYIDACDTLGQKAEEKKIHKALVSVYCKILEFYQAVCEILSKKGIKLIIKMILESDRLPSIAEDVLKSSNILHDLVQTTTLKVLQDVESMIINQQISAWLGADKMEVQTQHNRELKDLCADQACEFLLKNENFLNWYHSSSPRQLVILGETGCGKSVAMAFIVERLLQSEHDQIQIPNPMICYHYCRDDKTGKITTILSVLILSLLEKLPGLKKKFFNWYQQVQTLGSIPGADFKILEELLRKLLITIDRPVFFVIDGLDECDKDSRKKLLDFLKALLKDVPRLKTLLSSRPQEKILRHFGGAARIELVLDYQRDRIIAEKTVDMYLYDLSAEVKSIVIDKLSRRANGSAIWTRMTVKLIELRELTTDGGIARLLDEMVLPESLSDLYNLLFSRCTGDDSENSRLAKTALKFLTTTDRPLSILELAWAVTLDAFSHVTTVHALEQLVDHQRIMSLIHPFISRVDFNDLKKYQVRLAHHSVKEFILKECISEHIGLQGPALVAAPLTKYQCSRSLETLSLNICIKYLLLEEISNRNLFSDEQIAILELPQECDIFGENEEPIDYDAHCTWETWEENMIHFDPTERGFGELFVYASCYWIKHFGAAEIKPLPELASIERLCQAGSTRLRNWIQQNCRPGCAITARFQFDYRLYDPLSVTSLYGSVPMLRDMLENSDFADGVYLPDLAMGAADQILRWGDISRLRILFFDGKVGHQLQNLDFFRRIIKTWQESPSHNQETPSHNHHWDDVFALVDAVSDKMVHGRWGNELLCVAAGAGCMPIIRRLMRSTQHNEGLRSELLRGSRKEPQWTLSEPHHQSIGEAILGNHLDVVKYLIKENEIDAHLRYHNSSGENVLHLASMMCNPAMFQLLAPRFPEGITQVDVRGDTALERVIMNFSAPGNRFESARILLSQTADWHLAEKHYRRIFSNMVDDS